MQNDAGLPIDLEHNDIEAYWKGRAYIEAARMAHDAEADKTANTMSYTAIAPFLEQGREAVREERESHTGELPDAVFGPGETLEPRFVILLALMLDSENPVGSASIKNLAKMSSKDRDRRIVVVLNGHNTRLARILAEEMDFKVSNGTIELAEAVRGRISVDGCFESDFTTRGFGNKGMDESIRQTRQKHNRVGRNSGNQRFNAKPQRQNFKGRGR